MSEEQQIQKVSELIKKFNPRASEEELNREAKSLYELAVFFVRLKIKQHSKSEENVREPP